ncbi:MAG: hypothetical protein DRP06_00590 [Candidatus Aenigmatarchaeota archaeon]|nr:MAG: hypothetical protein DRP06_00590 [Candidatus Aenigmarchaeota archaeon]
MDKKLKESIANAARSIGNSLPVLTGVILLIGLIETFVPKSIYPTLFSNNVLLDPIIGSGLGSILIGNPVTSYVLGGELLLQGVSLVAVTAFIVSWVTVGLIQLPAEATLLGKKFAVARNILSFIFSIIVAITTVFIISL